MRSILPKSSTTPDGLSVGQAKPPDSPPEIGLTAIFSAVQ